MCEDCQRRLTTNVSRMLDCKNPGCQEIIAGAPKIADLLCPESKDYFSKVCQSLDNLGVEYEVAPRLVRGLDYYIHTVFEVTHSGLGGNDAILGGGRYQITPPGAKNKVEGIGFAAGMERILMARASRQVKAEGSTDMDIMIVCLGESAVPYGLKIAQQLRQALPGKRIKADFSARSLKAQMRTANKVGAKTVLMLGENEIAQGVVIRKNMVDSTQDSLPLGEVVAAFKA